MILIVLIQIKCRITLYVYEFFYICMGVLENN